MGKDILKISKVNKNLKRNKMLESLLLMLHNNFKGYCNFRKSGSGALPGLMLDIGLLKIN